MNIFKESDDMNGKTIKRKMLITSDPLKDLFGDDTSTMPYLLFADFVGMLSEMFHVDTLVLCRPYDYLKSVLEDSMDSMIAAVKRPISLEIREEIGEGEDSFTDIDVVLMLLCDHNKGNIFENNVRPISSILPTSNHLKERSVILYKYDWQLQDALDLYESTRNKGILNVINTQVQVGRHNIDISQYANRQ